MNLQPNHFTVWHGFLGKGLKPESDFFKNVFLSGSKSFVFPRLRLKSEERRYEAC